MRSEETRDQMLAKSQGSSAKEEKEKNAKEGEKKKAKVKEEEKVKMKEEKKEPKYKSHGLFKSKAKMKTKK